MYYVCTFATGISKTASIHMLQISPHHNPIVSCCGSLEIFGGIEQMYIQSAALLTAINYMNVKKSGNSNGRWHSSRNSEEVFQCPYDKRKQQRCEYTTADQFGCEVNTKYKVALEIIWQYFVTENNMGLICLDQATRRGRGGSVPVLVRFLVHP